MLQEEAVLEQLVLMLGSANATARAAAAACLCDLALSGGHPAQCVAQVRLVQIVSVDPRP